MRNKKKFALNGRMKHRQNLTSRVFVHNVRHPLVCYLSNGINVLNLHIFYCPPCNQNNIVTIIRFGLRAMCACMRVFFIVKISKFTVRFYRCSENIIRDTLHRLDDSSF